MAFDTSFPRRAESVSTPTRAHQAVIQAVYSERADELTRLAAKLLGDNKHDAEDVVHDAMIVLLEMKTLPANPAAYLAGIVRRKCATFRRDVSRFDTSESE